ncbi:MAG: helix-turn-helix domain-containing protein [Pseudomonadota bacterium]
MPTTLTILLAHKGLNLAEGLLPFDRSVMGTIIDCYNRRTGRCDPSISTIADLVGCDPRTVIRSTQRLGASGFLRKIKHGGNNHCNQYEPNWQKLLNCVAEWKSKKANRRKRSKLTPESVSQCIVSHIASDRTATQTFSTNQSKLTLPTEAKSQAQPLVASGAKSRSSITSVQSPSHFVPRLSFGISSKQVARDAAERRWNRDLQHQFGSDAKIYGDLIEGVTSEIMTMATDAELKERGAGIVWLIQEIFKRRTACSEGVGGGQISGGS